MRFPVYDLHVHLPQSFVNAIEEGLQVRKPELILLPGTTGQHTLYAFQNYLRRQAQALAEAGHNVVVVDDDLDDAEMAAKVAAQGPGNLVVFPELRHQPGVPSRSVAVAAEFVKKGATVFAVIHGDSRETAQSRLAQLWAQARADPIVSSTDELPPYRIIPFAGHVEKVPVARN